MSDLMPSEFYLGQNYPNPFKERTTIKYCVPQRCGVVLTVRDSSGKTVQRLVDEEKEPGTYEVIWNAKSLSKGDYTYEMKAGDFKAVKKMSLHK